MLSYSVLRTQSQHTQLYRDWTAQAQIHAPRARWPFTVNFTARRARSPEVSGTFEHQWTPVRLRAAASRSQEKTIGFFRRTGIDRSEHKADVKATVRAVPGVLSAHHPSAGVRSAGRMRTYRRQASDSSIAAGIATAACCDLAGGLRLFVADVGGREEAGWPPTLNAEAVAHRAESRTIDRIGVGIFGGRQNFLLRGTVRERSCVPEIREAEEGQFA